MPLDVGIEADVTRLVRALDDLGERGVRYVDEGVRSLAHDVARKSSNQVQGRSSRVARSIRVYGQDGVYLVGAQKDGDDDRLANWMQYGTGRRREASKRRSDVPGMKGKRFLRRPPKKVQQAIVLAAVIRAARRAGFEIDGAI